MQERALSDSDFGEMPSPTHPPVDIMKLFEIVEGLAGYVGEGEITAEVVESYAEKEGHSKGEVYAALVFDPTLEFRMQHESKVEVCTGRCQLFGGIELVDRLVAIRDERMRAGKSAFDLVPRNCMDICDFPPAIRTTSAAGIYPHKNVSKEDLAELISAACD